MTDRWHDLLQHKLIILDGSTGTLLQRQGLPGGASPEQFCLDHPEVLNRIQTEYLDAGSDVIYTPTFGANRLKLQHYGLDGKVTEINRRLADLSVKLARSRGRLAAGDIGPTGLFFAPFGERPLEEGLEVFREQIRALAAAGVDLLVIETMVDIQEARLALLAAKDVCALPVIVSMTFDEHGRTLTGSDPLTCLNVFQSLGAAAFGINCSTGPEAMVPLVKLLKADARIPLVVKPNAGLPVVEDGQTVFPMSAEAFAAFAEPFWEAGVNCLGGCCGTTPDHIRLTAQKLAGKTGRLPVAREGWLLLSSARRTVAVVAGPGEPLRVIGERINPTGKPALQAQLKHGQMEQVKTLALLQQEQGADLLDVNVGVPGADEQALMLAAVAALSLVSELPLCLDSSSPEVLAAALRLYPGRALVNSVSGERAKLERLLPVVAQFGAAFIVLPLDDAGIPETLERRQAILTDILERCAARNIPLEHIVVDGLALTASANPAHAFTALQTVHYAAQELRLQTVLGLSNVSFGLPARPWLNGAFLAMAASQGLSAVIANPGDPVVMDLRASADVLTGRDPGGRAFIARFAARPVASETNEAAAERPLRRIILRGEKEKIADALAAALAQGAEPMALLERELFPAIQEVGEKYQRHELFLPQLIAAAETMEQGVQALAPHLRHENRAAKGTVALATVKGDIHDIGKKIVALLLKNNGYAVIDLGKSLDEEAIVGQAVAQGADVIGLSALMTTTMTEMPKVIALAHRRAPALKVIVGGAVVTPKYAEEIGADGYAADSVQAVTLVDRLINQGRESKIENRESQ
jgi:5-methyltetrahydrofolate--homocysteine methyltransferase